MMHNLAPLLITRRQQEHLSLSDVAQAVGVSAPTIMRIERGTTPQARTYQKLAAWLGLDVPDHPPTPVLSPLDQAALILYSDPALDHHAATIIVRALRGMYDALARSTP